jgi:hypothetical protein
MGLKKGDSFESLKDAITSAMANVAAATQELQTADANASEANRIVCAARNRLNACKQELVNARARFDEAYEVAVR